VVKNNFFDPSGEITDRIKKLGYAKMARTSSVTMPRILSRAPAVDEKVLCFLAVFCHALE